MGCRCGPWDPWRWADKFCVHATWFFCLSLPYHRAPLTCVFSPFFLVLLPFLCGGCCRDTGAVAIQILPPLACEWDGRRSYQNAALLVGAQYINYCVRATPHSYLWLDRSFFFLLQQIPSMRVWYLFSFFPPLIDTPGRNVLVAVQAPSNHLEGSRMVGVSVTVLRHSGPAKTAVLG